MTRTIKFRAWNGKKMQYDVSINDGKPVRKGYQWFSQENDIHYSEPLQFTGLLDKNGVEIYEGDIVKLIGNELPDEIVTVINENCSFHFKSINNSMRINKPLYCWAVDYLGHFKSIGVEIIGNIYENPELISSKE